MRYFIPSGPEPADRGYMPGVGPIDEEPETETEEVEEVEPEEEDLDYYNMHITNTCYPPTFFYFKVLYTS
jgi:hypothetical protein